LFKANLRLDISLWAQNKTKQNSKLLLCFVEFLGKKEVFTISVVA